jgi:hypothetical protein
MWCAEKCATSVGVVFDRNGKYQCGNWAKGIFSFEFEKQ